MNSFGEELSNDASAYGSLILSDAWSSALEPAPVSPSGLDSIPYTLLAGTIKATVTDSGITHKEVGAMIQTAIHALIFFLHVLLRSLSHQESGLAVSI